MSVNAVSTERCFFWSYIDYSYYLGRTDYIRAGLRLIVGYDLKVVLPVLEMEVHSLVLDHC